ncbi:FecCD family ABC transporter permease [Desulfitobacterium chlororespirans]|uniref:Iron complex transport system permease protein n=1 Tax=Desulfitobacterium chlororespirans DSM 11544 TaxID=1121395 RepID=A0A1M7TWY3_9FIRM|nr:iron ABC transporter permease [Desulfitobacterium chlororespirans]SHN75222.1 iron complex transport system permease protein [Desulfitobacterium chlororespirans DSM 11544]
MDNITQKQYVVIIIALFAALTLAIIGSMLFGRYEMGFMDIYNVLLNRLAGTSDDALKIIDHVLINVRLPRILLAGLVGAGLSISGAALQGTFQNPLVSPDLLGVCAGAGFGAALGILLFSDSSVFISLLPFLLGVSSILLVFFLANTKGQTETLSLVLSGIIVSSIFNALISLVKYVADTGDKLPAITFWLMGSFANTSYTQLRIAIIPALVGIIGVLILRWKINILSLGDEDAYTMGINPQHTRWLIILFCTLVTAACVTVSGIIGWIGLVIPHIARRIVGVNHGKLLPVSCLLGAVFMILVDCLARNLTTSEIPISILTALIGAPFFAVIYRRTKGGA